MITVSQYPATFKNAFFELIVHLPVYCLVIVQQAGIPATEGNVAAGKGYK